MKQWDLPFPSHYTLPIVLQKSKDLNTIYLSDWRDFLFLPTLKLCLGSTKCFERSLRGAWGGRFWKSALPTNFNSSMAAAGDEKESDDKDPDPVIVEKTAETVVIHKISSLGDMCLI